MLTRGGEGFVKRTPRAEYRITRRRQGRRDMKTTDLTGISWRTSSSDRGYRT